MNPNNRNLGSESRLIGDYPYYRDSPNLWEEKLILIKELGIQCVSCYVPWRHHENTADNSINFGGEGNRNLYQFIEIAQSLDLKILLKPGPFIHAEVAFGGLPDRLCARRNTKITALKDASGNEIVSEGRVFPAYNDEIFINESVAWMKQFGKQVLLHYANVENNSIERVQIGNEGIFSDSNATVHLYLPIQTLMTLNVSRNVL